MDLTRALALYGGFAVLMAVALALPSETVCLLGVAWIAGGSSALASDVVRWSRRATSGLGLSDGALVRVVRVGGGVVGALALTLALGRLAR
ncbi:MAG: hypothetical protein R3C39_12290 [Dehalococcoidia bacterium]